MPTYIVLIKLTDQGMREIKSAPQRIEAAKKAIEARGGRITNFYVTMGEYDYISVVEGTSDEEAMVCLLGLGAAGNVRTITLKAFTTEQLAGMLEKL